MMSLMFCMSAQDYRMADLRKAGASCPKQADGRQRTVELRLVARKTGAGSGGGIPGAALRTLVGFVAGDVELQQGARRDVQFEASSAAVNDRAGSDDEAAFLFYDADGFAGRTAGGPHILDDQSFFA